MNEMPFIKGVDLNRYLYWHLPCLYHKSGSHQLQGSNYCLLSLVQNHSYSMQGSRVTMVDSSKLYKEMRIRYHVENRFVSYSHIQSRKLCKCKGNSICTIRIQSLKHHQMWVKEIIM